MPLPGNILIADDERHFLMATAAFLRAHGYHCDCVENAEKAVQMLQEKEFDLLISDIEMPGNENLALVRSIPQLVAGLPVILVTGHPTVQTATQSFQFSVVAYLVKPFEPGELLEQAGKAIERHRAYRVVQQNRRRLEHWCSDLQKLETLIRAEPGNSAAGAWEAFPDIALQQIAGSLQDLQHYTEAATRQKAPPNCETDSVSTGVLLEAVQETITVLEKTKNAFKSKDLGDLRRRLEKLMATPRES